MPTDLNERMAELEQRLAVVEAALASTTTTASVAAPPQRPVQAPARPAPAPHTNINWERLGSGEGWLGRAGIALLVVGLILLYRYAVARGWLTPELRIGIGLLVGLGLLLSGTRFFAERRLYRQILMAGGIVILFLTGLAAAELYHLIRGTIALLFFVALAGTAYTIAARQAEPTMASIGALGALLPPAFLLADAVPGPVLWLYLLVIVLWTGLLVVLRGWHRTMLLTAAATAVATYHTVPPARSAQFAAALVLLAAWFCYAALPLLRVRVLEPAAVNSRLQRTVVLFLPFVMTVALAAAAELYLHPNAYAFEICAAVGAVGFGAVALRRATRDPDPTVAAITLNGQRYLADGFSAATAAGVLSLAAAAMIGIEWPWWAVAVALVAVFALALAQVADAQLLRPVAHGLNSLLAIAFLLGVGTLASNRAFDALSVSFIIVTAIAAYVALQFLQGHERLAYLAAVYFAVHVLLATELTAV
ncbi:MAG TPA: DUF2339 domain-containing protein, partial [Longimicrobiales bacterium]